MSRLPMAVFVRSSTQSSVPRFSPLRMVRVNSKLRRAARSRRMKRALL